MLAVIVFAVFSAVALVCACQGEPAGDESAVASERTLVGQVLLPGGNGSRGVEVVATVAEAGSESRRVWILFDEQGRFSHTFQGSLERVVVSTGLRSDLHRIEADGFPKVNRSGQVNVGVIDLRDRLVTHQLVLRADEGTLRGEVRVAMCFGLPPVGPSGEPVSLGSRQFPPVALGSTMEWLLPYSAESVYFLVERPSGEGEWRGGYQRLFGPFTSANLPSELIMD